MVVKFSDRERFFFAVFYAFGRLCFGPRSDTTTVICIYNEAKKSRLCKLFHFK